MLFNSFVFAIFFAVTTGVFLSAPQRWRVPVLLAASYLFYGWWSVKYLGVIVGITLIDYFAALRIEQAWGGRRKAWLGLSVAANLGILFVFKYADFFSAVLHTGLAPLRLALPIGISFHTFQAVGYTVDVYRGKIRAEPKLAEYALFVAFFPQMVAGPIERADRLLPQFRQRVPFDYGRVADGLRMVLRGLMKKTVIADLAAPAVNRIYGHPRDFPAPMLLLGTVLFSAQIYCDFSGYSDMAVGLARVLGYDLTVNFREPWRAQSMEEFWQRWHISLSQWFRDYVYIPLGGNRVPTLRWAANLMVVFLLSGLWHGANLTFVLWGALHGLFLLAERLMRRFGRRGLGVLGTNVLVTFAWIFFRAGSLPDALYIASRVLWPAEGFRVEQLWMAGLPRFEMVFLLLSILCLAPGERLIGTRASESRVIRWGLGAAGVYGVVFFGVFQHIDFIYFRF